MLSSWILRKLLESHRSECLSFAESHGFCTSDLDEETVLLLKSQPTQYLRRIREGLSTNGILVVSVAGDVHTVDSRSTSYQSHLKLKRELDVFQKELQSAGFLHTKTYSEHQIGFSESRTYTVSFREDSMVRNWNRNSAQINREIHRRMGATKLEDLPFQFFDGAIMESYNKFEQNVDNCQLYPTAAGCTGEAVAPLSAGHIRNVGSQRLLHEVVHEDTSQNLSSSEECYVYGQDQNGCNWNTHTVGSVSENLS